MLERVLIELGKLALSWALRRALDKSKKESRKVEAGKGSAEKLKKHRECEGRISCALDSLNSKKSV